MSVFTWVKRAANALQASGIVASRLVGTIRRVELNPTWYAASEVRALLRRMAQADPGLCAVAGFDSKATSPRA